MPIKVYCPACDAPIRAPESAAGTRVECPECDALVKVPRADKGKGRARDDDDRPRRRSDDRDDRPRKGRKKKKARSNRALIIGLVAGAVFLVVAVVVGGIVAYRMSQPDPDRTMAGADWYKADDPDGLFTAYFPGDKPKYEKHGFQPSEFLAKKAAQKAEEMGFSTQIWTRKDGGREYSVSVMTLPGNAGGTMAEQAVAQTKLPPGRGVTIVADDTVPVGNRPARRLVTRSGSRGQACLFLGIGGRQMMSIAVVGDGVDHNDPKVQAFFDNLTLKR